MLSPAYSLPNGTLHMTVQENFRAKKPSISVSLHMEGGKIAQGLFSDEIKKIIKELPDQSLIIENPDDQTLVLKSNALTFEKTEELKTTRNNMFVPYDFVLLKHIVPEVIKHTIESATHQEYSIPCTDADGTKDQMYVKLNINPNVYDPLKHPTVRLSISLREADFDVRWHNEMEDFAKKLCEAFGVEFKPNIGPIKQASWKVQHLSRKPEKQPRAMAIIHQLWPELERHLTKNGEYRVNEIQMGNREDFSIVLEVESQRALPLVYKKITEQLSAMQDKGITLSGKRTGKEASTSEKIATILREKLPDLDDSKRRTIRLALERALGQGPEIT
jgi:hypothetical protein